MSDRLRVVLAEILGLEILQPAVHVLTIVLTDDIVVDEHGGFRSQGQCDRVAGRASIEYSESSNRRWILA